MNRRGFDLLGMVAKIFPNRGGAWGCIIIGALLAFEVFNFSTTQFALESMFGDLTFGPFTWATWLSIAFCAIDFAGIARMFTPEQGRDEPAEVYFLFGGWLLGAGFNATLTWWGVSVAISQNGHGITAVGGMAETILLKVVPIFIAAMVWLIRVLIIGTFSLAGDRMFTTAPKGTPMFAPREQPRFAPPSETHASIQQASPQPLARPVVKYQPKHRPDFGPK